MSQDPGQPPPREVTLTAATTFGELKPGEYFPMLIWSVEHTETAKGDPAIRVQFIDGSVVWAAPSASIHAESYPAFPAD